MWRLGYFQHVVVFDIVVVNYFSSLVQQLFIHFGGGSYFYRLDFPV